MTVSELETKRDALIAQLAQPQDMRGPGGMGVTNRSTEDIQRAIAALDVEIAKAKGTSNHRYSLAEFSKG